MLRGRGGILVVVDTRHPLLRAQNNRGSDYIQTPKWALHPLLSYLNPDWLIWEPAEGKGNLTSELNIKGWHALGTDINSGSDFLRWQPVQRHCIVTNPPYSKKDAFLRRCYDLGKPFALLLPLTALGSKKRQALYRKHGIQLLMLGERVHFDTGSGKQHVWFESAWFTWGLNLPTQIVFGQRG